MQRAKASFAYAQTDTAKTATMSGFNGMIRSIVYVLPDLTTAVSGVLTFKDNDGNLIYTSGTINENTSTLVSSLAVPIGDKYTATFTLNAGSGKAGTDTVNIYFYVENI